MHKRQGRRLQSTRIDSIQQFTVQSRVMTLPIVYHPDFVSPLPSGHRFPMPKFGRIYEMLVRDHIASFDQFHVPEIVTIEQLQLVHSPEYVHAFINGELDPLQLRRIGLPWSPSLVNRTRAAVGGTLLTAELALAFGVACSTAGGTHHAHAGFGSGYCIFNDLAVAARYYVEGGQVDRVLIVDLDVHQGDGTATIFAEDASVFTFSMHCGANFPFRKSASDLDISLPELADEDLYMECLRTELPKLINSFKPGLVLYDAGVDPHRLDRLGKLAMTDTGLYSRDYFVISQCLSKDTPVACVVGGGYDTDVDRLSRRHCLMHAAASEAYEFYGLG